MTSMTPVLGLLGALVGIACTVPYVRDTVSGTTRPHRGTWLIWGVLAVVACVSQRADGASWSLVLTGSQAVLTALVFALALRYGEGGLTRVDLTLISVAGAGVVGWLIAHDPVIAVVCVIVADLVAAAMMTPKAYRDPHSETLAMFALASVAGALAAGAVGEADVSLLLYPGYYCVVNGSMALLLFCWRGQLRSARRSTVSPTSRDTTIAT